jgi:4-diphosphocytidyl-2-C-methyl-D-erythritol kinase
MPAGEFRDSPTPLPQGEGAFAAFAPAKINLALHVLGRRADGFHLLDSLVVFAGVGDTLRAEPADALSLTFEGRFGAALATEADNLVLRAARLLAAAAGVPCRARMVLRKDLPVASGIGGGSADAAAALRLLSRLWRLDVPAADIAALALRLGADVPVCRAGRPARMAGVGEVLAPLPDLPECGLLLVNPGVAVATHSVFSARTGAFSPPLDVPPRWPDAASLAATLARAGNDLQAPAITVAPVIADVLAAVGGLQHCLLARMSGSGATCFGLFPTPDEAEAAAIGVRRPGWWVWGGGLSR